MELQTGQQSRKTSKETDPEIPSLKGGIAG